VVVEVEVDGVLCRLLSLVELLLVPPFSLVEPNSPGESCDHGGDRVVVDRRLVLQDTSTNTRSRRKSGRWGLIVANFSPGKLITLRTRPPSLSLPLPKSQKKPSSIPNLHILCETNAHFCFPNTPFKSGLRWSLEKRGFLRFESSIHFHGLYFFIVGWVLRCLLLF